MENRTVYRTGTLRWRLADIFIIIAIAVLVVYALLIYKGIAGASEQRILVTLLFGVIGIELIGMLAYAYFSKRIDREEAGPLRNLFRILAYVVLILILLTEFSINITGLLISAGFLGIVLGLAAQSTLSNFVSGIYLISSRAFEPGDRVIIHTWQYTQNPPTYPHDRFVPGFSGTIKTIGVLYTEFYTDEKLLMLMPNSIVAQAMVINYRHAEEHRTRLQFDVAITIEFDELAKRVRKVMKVQKISDYSIDIESLHDNLYVITMRLKLEEGQRARLKTEIYDELIKYLNSKHNEPTEIKVVK